MYGLNESGYHSSRNDDTRICGYITQKIRELLFPFLIARFKNRASFEIITDTKRQREGVDIILYRGPCREPYYYDLKAQHQWVNVPIQTHALEIDSYQNLRGKGRTLVDGWFVNDDLLTTHYMFIAVVANSKQVGRREWRKITPDNIEGLEVFGTCKARLNEDFSANGLTRDRIFAKRDEIRGMGIAGKVKMQTGIDGVEIMKCDRNTFPEESVNLLISKEKLSKLSDFYAFADLNGIKTYKERGRLLISEYKPVCPAKAVEKPKVVKQGEFSFDLTAA